MYERSKVNVFQWQDADCREHKQTWNKERKRNYTSLNILGGEDFISHKQSYRFVRASCTLDLLFLRLTRARVLACTAVNKNFFHEVYNNFSVFIWSYVAFLSMNLCRISFICLSFAILVALIVMKFRRWIIFLRRRSNMYFVCASSNRCVVLYCLLFGRSEQKYLNKKNVDRFFKIKPDSAYCMRESRLQRSLQKMICRFR